jgi:hypothetical protein
MFETAISLTWYFILLFVVWRWSAFRLVGFPPYVVVILFTIKVLAGVLLTYFYTYLYNDRFNSDLFKLYDDSKHIYDALPEKPMDFIKMTLGIDADNPYYDRYYYRMFNWFPYYENTVHHDTRTMIRLNAFFRLFSFGAFQVHNIFMCFLSTLGLAAIYQTFYTYFTDRKLALLASVFLFPSAILWGSGMLKEGLMLLALGLFLKGIWPIIHHQINFKNLALTAIGFLIFVTIKIYVLLALLPGLALVYFGLRFQVKKWGFLFVSAGFAGLLFLCISPLIMGDSSPLTYLSNRQQDMLRLIYYTNPGSAVDMQPLQPKWFSLLRLLPEAYFNALFRPTLVESKGLLQLFSALENAGIIILIFTWFGLIQMPQKNKYVFWFLLSVAFILLALMGLTTPILGTLNRYRVPAMPFLFMAIFISIDFQRLKAVIQQIFRI